MQSAEEVKAARRRDGMRYAKGHFAVIPKSVMRYACNSGLGRNGLLVLMSLCCYVNRNGVLGKKSRMQIAIDTGMTLEQVSRGMKDLKDKLIIEPTMRWSETQKKLVPDRSNFGHVATYRLTEEVIRHIKEDLP